MSHCYNFINYRLDSVYIKRECDCEIENLTISFISLIVSADPLIPSLSFHKTPANMHIFTDTVFRRVTYPRQL